MDSTDQWVKPKTGDLCLSGSYTTHIILKDRKYFYNLIPIKANINTISGFVYLIIEESEKASFILPNRTKIFIDNALCSLIFERNLLSFNGIYRNRYDIETANEGNRRYLYLISNVSRKKCILEKLPTLPLGLHYTHINVIESHMIVYKKWNDL